MNAPRSRRLTLTLPSLTPAQADAILEVLGAVQDAVCAAYEDELLAAASEAAATAQAARAQDDRDADHSWEELLRP